jgi:hypothetical protein
LPLAIALHQFLLQVEADAATDNHGRDERRGFLAAAAAGVMMMMMRCVVVVVC